MININLKFSREGATEYQEDGKKTALVNAANPNLIGKSGIALAIQKQGGKKLVKELEKHKGCKVTENIVTDAYDLSDKFSDIIHAVGPDLREAKNGFTDKNKKYSLEKGTTAQEAFNLTYLNIILTAINKGITDIACPVIAGSKFKGKETEDKIAEMTIKAIIYADEQLEELGYKLGESGHKINLVMCTYEKDGQGYLDLLQKWYDLEVPQKTAPLRPTSSLPAPDESLEGKSFVNKYRPAGKVSEGLAILAAQGDEDKSREIRFGK
jgi:O-acetyl-ADP-ribose deacetylase (regulator of RNase III)